MTAIKTKNGWKIKNHKTGKIYPKTYKTKAEANKRIKQMEYFKNKKKNNPKT